MLRLVFRDVRIVRWDYAGVEISAGGESLCIDVLKPPCRHVLYTHIHPRHYGGVGGLAPPAVKPGDRLELGPFAVSVVEAYNMTKLINGAPVHPKGFGVGYLVEVGGVSLYHPGDTDLIGEMAKIKTDIFLAPIGGDGTMTAEEAAEAVKLIRPKIAIPIHFGEMRPYVKFRDISQPYTQVVYLDASPSNI
ncbi:beta-lactamase fold-like Zn-dependent hydrolase [Pyrobaculum islandicum DSM 4184]|uniref:Beta-lactamase fold-like Zn-dependent hydrolase n=1 Tax=Pyrobaculum islandicum (strain DSM 4184 / JCM 9189 / GEO3) TaxID=384616 RepID=A1RR04_PYRIL|nr:MBL fold metallo-hydrolase [Pyrobaculum islandicum]ABL87386.1 beta-lactamase fold-like Zn-dependent hydrolase [Pyrobaculum islandicum DSM 4184]